MQVAWAKALVSPGVATPLIKQWSETPYNYIVHTAYKEG